MLGNGMASADALEQQDAARSGRDQQNGRAPFPAFAPRQSRNVRKLSDMVPEYPMPTSNLVIAPRLRPLAKRPRLLRRCALFATGRVPNEVAPTAGAM
jgi:hypothetical protein